MRTQLIGAALGLLLVWTPVRAQPADTAGAESSPGLSAAAQPSRDAHPDAVESFMLKWADRFGVSDSREAEHDPGPAFYPRFGGIRSGAGVSAGVGYRLPLARGSELRFGTTVSHRLYSLTDVELSVPVLNDRTLLESTASFRTYTDEEFYGLGPDTGLGDQASFEYQEVDTAMGLRVRNPEGLEWGGRVGYLRTNPDPFLEDDRLDVSERFTEPSAPGMDASQDFLRFDLFGDYDDRSLETRMRLGRFYGFRASSVHDLRHGDFGYRQIEVEGGQVLPLFGDTRAIAVRGLATLTDAGDDGMPFYLMPDLGGSRSLRGYHSFRFRDHHRLLLNAELRQEVRPYLDVALFGDAGTVARRVEDLDVGRVLTNYGVGFRLKLRGNPVARLDIGLGGEDRRIWLSFNQPF